MCTCHGRWAGFGVKANRVDPKGSLCVKQTYLELSILGHNPQRRTEKKNLWVSACQPGSENLNVKMASEHMGQGQRLRGSAYPFGLGAHGRVLGVVGWRIGKVDLHVVRHFFQKVRGYQAFLPIQFPLKTRQGTEVVFIFLEPTACFRSEYRCRGTLFRKGHWVPITRRTLATS
jgi:hypothetical protein